MTETQARRLAARIAGDSLATIAAREGCSPQAVSKSLAVPAARGLILGRAARDPDTGEAIDFIAEALRVVLHCATGAEKPVVLTTTSYGETTQAIHYVPDHPTRLAAATKILALVDRDQTPPAAIAVEERETITRTRERRRVAQVDG